VKTRGPQQKDGSWHEELKMESLFKQATGSHSPTSTMLLFVALITQPSGRVTFLELGIGEQESTPSSGNNEELLFITNERKNQLPESIITCHLFLTSLVFFYFRPLFASRLAVCSLIRLKSENKRGISRQA
jgi:hypothetical protein